MNVVNIVTVNNALALNPEMRLIAAVMAQRTSQLVTETIVLQQRVTSDAVDGINTFGIPVIALPQIPIQVARIINQAGSNIKRFFKQIN